MVKKSVPEPPFIHTICTVYEANIYCDIAGYKQKRYLGLCETTFKNRFGNHKKSLNHLNIKMTRNYQNFFGKSKNTMDHQKLHGKISEYVVLTIQIVSAAFYV